MTAKHNHWCRQAAAVSVAIISAASPALGQSEDALINKLLEKGILSAQEAKELKAESNRNFTTTLQNKMGTPDWVTAWKFGGDFRGRFDGIYGENDAQVDRNRLRYRLRFGVAVTLLDDFEVGVRLGSGEPVSGFGGSPISANQSFADNGSKKFLWLNLAYARWTPLHTPDFSGAFTFGKMENPFVFPSFTIFGKDYAPEGLAAQFAYKVNAQHSLKLNSAAFVLDESSLSTSDPWMGGVQLRWDAGWTKEISTSFGITGLGITGTRNLSNADVPNVNRGNTRNAAGAPTAGFTPVCLDGSFTYTLEHFPGFAGRFPISVSGDYLNNPATKQNNEAYSIGVMLGKAAKKGQWSLSYRWTEIQADAWLEEVMDSDFAGYYQVQQPNAGFTSAANPTGSGYAAGSNVHGHIFRADYSPYDSLTISLTYFLTELINASPAGSKSGAGRVQLDALWKF